jgi:hypothetical protein
MTNTTMPNNILIASQKLFRTQAPWRINRSFMGQLTNDHDVILFDYNTDTHTSKQKAKQISTILYSKLQKSYNKLIFVGLDKDCIIAPELSWMGYDIDAAAIINSPYDPLIYTCMFDHTAIYNFYTSKKYSKLDIQGAECNQHVPTVLPAHMSNRLATEVAGCLLYQTHQKTYLDPTPAKFTTI